MLLDGSCYNGGNPPDAQGLANAALTGSGVTLVRVASPLERRLANASLSQSTGTLTGSAVPPLGATPRLDCLTAKTATPSSQRTASSTWGNPKTAVAPLGRGLALRYAMATSLRSAGLTACAD
ncbi:hypothetical protein [Dendronalium sp. ChiSLP03b]|uniref:hypothetical protein n=1 Tax=Dendronalium sp. ChiSLP03b TaxID=3075381 RepID=UPI002AD431F5|nr:hypothetical protein [Dendronalium sp. ChiSLP03b]MDZ8208399.1 hypothetical protein [Dendronalium sp. ChiSLP03b]